MIPLTPSPPYAGSFGYREEALLDLVTTPLDATAGDFNGDGHDDLAVADFQGSTLTVVLGRGDGTFRLAFTEGGAHPDTRLLSADFDGDGRDDLVTATFPSVAVRFAVDVPPEPLAQFGLVGGASRPSVTVVGRSPTDGSTGEVTFKLKGPGSGQIFDAGPGAGLRVVLDGTTDKSALTVTTARNQPFLMSGLQVNGSLKSFVATTSAALGDLAVTGTLGRFVIFGVIGGSKLTISGAGVPTTVLIPLVQDLTLNTQSPIAKLQVHRWMDEDALPDVITAPSIGSISAFRAAARDGRREAIFEAGVHVTGGGTSLKSMSIQGALSESDIRTAGDIGSIQTETALAVTVYAGVDLALSALPVSADAFVSRATIGRFRVTGRRPSRELDFCGSCRIGAASVGAFQIPNNRTLNGGAELGLAAGSVKSYARGNNVKKANLTSPGVFDSENDYVARIVARLHGEPAEHRA